MKAYLDLVSHVLEHGSPREDRTGTGTISVFGTQTRYDLRAGFPLLTTKKVLFSAVVRELLWFLRGSTNINDNLTQHTPIWNAWADEAGELGPVYGHQWRHWGAHFRRHARDRRPVFPPRAAWGDGIDQIQAAVDTIRADPFSRRNVVTAWNPNDVPHMALPPCHMMFQLYVTAGNCLNLQLYQRSADLALGVPFNIASYALLLMILSQETGTTPGEFIHTIGDAHIYRNHVDGLQLQRERATRELPRVRIAEKPLSRLAYGDIELDRYDPHPFVKFDVSV